MVDVIILLTGANEGSTPLEAASLVDDPQIKIEVIDFFEAADHTHGIDVRSIKANSKYDIIAYKRLIEYLSARDPDVLHIHPNAVGAVVRILVKFIGDLCMITTEHNTHDEFGCIRNLVNGGTNWLNDIVVSNSEATNESLRTWERALLSIGKTDTAVIHYGANINAIDEAITQREPPELPDGFRVVTGGRLAEQKNIGSLIRSMPILDQSDIQLVITGDGPKRAALEQLARDLNIENKVSFLGWLPERKDVYTVYNSSDIFLFPSYYEGFGVANVEAMATGTPVIVNDIPVLREVVGDAGLFVDATEPRQLADAIRELYDNPELRERLGEKARKRARTHFPLAKTVRKYNEVYRSCNDT
jgi:glycosyltransferase involved in cell wall biosynthesis